MTRGLLTFLGFLLCGGASAQSYPMKPVRLIVAFAPGGGNDVIARLVAQKLTAAFGRPFVVDNRPGAGGTIGVELAAKSAPDGHTLFLAGVATHAVTTLPLGSPPDEFTAHIRDELARVGKVIKTAGITLE